MESQGGINFVDIRQEGRVAEDVHTGLVVKENPSIGDQSIILGKSKVIILDKSKSIEQLSGHSMEGDTTKWILVEPT
jgi:hypothetical protein